MFSDCPSQNKIVDAQFESSRCLVLERAFNGEECEGTVHTVHNLQQFEEKNDFILKLDRSCGFLFPFSVQ